MNNYSVFHEPPSDFAPAVEIGAVYVTVGDQILFMQLAAGKKEAGAWGVPAGKLEAGEEPVNGAARELFEETGIQVGACQLTPCGKLFIRKPEVDYVYHLFSLPLAHFPEIALSQEHTTFRFFTFQETLAIPLMQGAKEALAYFIKKKAL